MTCNNNIAKYTNKNYLPESIITINYNNIQISNTLIIRNNYLSPGTMVLLFQTGLINHQDVEQKMKLNSIFFALLFILPTSSYGQVQVSAGADFVTQYVWRGFDVLDDREAIQPSVTISGRHSGFSLNIWGSAGLTDRDVTANLDELDFTLSYGKSIGDLFSIEFGAIHYNFPGMKGYFDDNSNSLEIFGSAATSVPVIGSFSLAAYYDTNMGDGLYVQAGYAKDFTLLPAISPEFSFDIGYNGECWGINEKGISHADAGLFLPLRLNGIELGIGVYNTYLFSDKLEALNNGDKSEFWAKVNLSISY